MNELIAWHRQHYPQMESQDVVKILFQAMLGCGHLLGPAEMVTQRIIIEESALTPNADEPLTEPMGQRYMRLNLRRAMAEGIRPEWIASMMKASLPPLHDRADVVTAADALGDAAVSKLARRLLDEPDWLPSHTSAYHEAYHPAYRIISTDWLHALQALCGLTKHWHKERILMVIDGPCGSGKTTLASKLGMVLDAAIISMDDFFLPHPQKTAERLAQPGGNVDWERLCKECLRPWLRGQQIAYRPYDCMNDTMSSPVDVPNRKVTIIEGSYSMLPDIAQHADVRIFLTVSPQEQQRRILHRNGEAGLNMFLNRWIPLEQMYFTAYGLPNDSCLVLHEDHVV